MACPQDSSFGPGSTCRGLDFTVAFEHGILSVAPDTIFILLSFVRLTYLFPLLPATKRSGWSFALLGGKTASALFVVGTTIAALVALRRHVFSGGVGLTAGILQIFSAVLLVVLVVFEHLRAIVPSTLIIIYTFVKALFSGAILRSAILIGDDGDAVVVLLGLVCAAYSLLLIAEIFGKGQGALEKHVPFMSATSFASRPLFHWLIPLMWTGRKKKLTIEDCGEIPFEMLAKESTDPLYAVLIRTPRTTSHYLVKSSLRAFPILLLAPILPRFLLILATLAQPLLVLHMITFIASSSSDNSHGWALVGGYIVTYAMIYLLTATCWERVFNSTVRFRGALVGNIYRKTLRLSSASGREVGGGAASTYMSVDVERICLGLETLHEFWAAFVTIILAVALLWTRVTWPAILPLIITLIFTLLTNRISRGVGTIHKTWLGFTDKRVKYLSSVFNHFMAIKLSAYEDVVESRAGELRKAEVNSLLKYYSQLSYIGALITVSPNMCLLGVLGAYAALAVHNPDAFAVDAASLFTIVTIVLVLAVPFTVIGTGYSSLLTAYASVKRVEKYLLLEEREIVNEPPEEKGSNSEGEDKKIEESFEPGKISVEGASFAWAADKDVFLKDVHASLEMGKLTVCAGPVASGKSMFILSLLRETVLLPSGKLHVPPGRIAYAAQDPLIIPGTIRENILFGREFEDGWYMCILNACALNRDLGELSGGDGTMVGEKGTSLSGGQRQRVALARAVYARAPWTFLDDPFSSLDGHTERHVANALFGTNGLLRGASVLLITNNYQHMQHAEQVLTFDSGSIKSLRSSAEIQASYHFTSGGDEEPAQTFTQRAAETKPHKAQKEVSEKPIAQSSLGWTPYLFYMKMTGLSLGICVLVLMVAIGLIRIGALVYVQQWSNSGGRHTGAWVGGYAAVTVAVFGLTKLGMFGYTYWGNRSIAQNLHQTELHGLVGTVPTLMTTTAPGQMISRFSQDIFVADGELVMNVLNVIMSATVIVGYVIFYAGPFVNLLIGRIKLTNPIAFLLAPDSRR
ncbi:hypothetical protein C8F01DRAFT_176953 [Mycena amicta]|nr:hypothetical protein C8F01DRAFT_176953 [Mycena amicta]